MKSLPTGALRRGRSVRPHRGTGAVIVVLLAFAVAASTCLSAAWAQTAAPAAPSTEAGSDAAPSAEAVDGTEDPLVLDGTEALLDAFLWRKRPLVIFADAPGDPRFIRQMELIEADPSELAKRDVVVLVDTDPSARSPLRRKFRPHGFMLVLVGKDGVVYLRKPVPWTVREISRSIDKMPLRQQELAERRRGGG